MQERADRAGIGGSRCGGIAARPTFDGPFPSRSGEYCWAALRTLAVVVLCLTLCVAVGSIFLAASNKPGAAGKLGGALLVLEDETAALGVAEEIADHLLDGSDAGEGELPSSTSADSKDAKEGQADEAFGFASSTDRSEHALERLLFEPRNFYAWTSPGDDEHSPQPLRGPPSAP